MRWERPRRKREKRQADPQVSSCLSGATSGGGGRDPGPDWLLWGRRLLGLFYSLPQLLYGSPEDALLVAVSQHAFLLSCV